MTKHFVILSLIFSSQAYARKTDGAVIMAMEKNEIILTAKKGFHFNDKAPASAVFDDLEAKFPPITKTEKKFVFKIVEKTKKAKLEYYVCDDAKTVCEPHKEEIVLERASAAEVKKDNEPPAAEQSFSFGKTTLLKFSAPWCPACIRLQSETVNQPQVKALLKKINYQDINIDLVENEKISNHYGVKAIPTVILVNSSGEELKRWLDYQSAKSFASELAAALKETQRVKDLTAKAEAGDKEAAIALGYNYYNKMNWKEAAKWLAVSENEKDLNYKLAADILAAQVVVEDESNEKKLKGARSALLEVLQKGYSLTTSQLDQARWKLDYLDQLKDQKSVWDADIIKSLQNQLAELKQNKNLNAVFAKSTLGNQENLELAEILYMTRNFYKTLDSKEGVAKTQVELKAFLDKAKLSTKLPGQMISAIWYYNQVEAVEKSEALLKQLTKAYDKTYVYYDRYSAFLSKQKRFDEAVKQIDLALQFQEGNEPQLSLSKIKILKELGKKEEALALIESTLKMTEAHPTKYKRTQTALQNLKKEIK